MAVTINGDTGVTTPGISNSEGYTGDGLTIAAGAPSGAVQVDTSGNAGIGVTPSAWATVKAIQVANGSMWGISPNDFGAAQNAYFNSGWKYISSSSPATLYAMTNGIHQWQIAPSGTAGTAISFTHAMTLDASGNLLVGTTSQIQSGKISVLINPTTNNGFTVGPSANADYDAMSMQSSNGTKIGSIRCTSTNTAYNTSSDYRLKENIQPMTGALAKVAALKPVIYKWKADGSDGEGFIAHELAEVVPQCVTGEKDAVDDEGKPVYQGIDTSFLVATLTAALQELKAQVDAQAVEIAALKGQA